MPVKLGSQRGRGGAAARGRGGGARGGRGRGGGTYVPVSQRGRGHGPTRGRSRGGGTTTHRPPNDVPRMTTKTWASIKDDGEKDRAEGQKLTPGILKYGPPPDPTASDSYGDKWKKLILMEFHASLSEFRRQQTKSREPFEDQAHVHVEFLSRDQESGKEMVEISTEVREKDGAEPWKAKDLTAVSPADLVKTLLKTESGWLYVMKICRSADEFPVTAIVVAYNNSFRRMPVSLEPQKAIVFDSFTTLIYRFESLCAFATETDADIKKVIENGLIHACREHKSTLRPVAKDARAKSKLNDSQFDILTKIRAPVDFVQGPPGTGKSTFIVEYVKMRLPKTDGARVLICTTTNKAIDSLTEKLAASGCGGEMLAVGNAARLGATSAQFLIQNRVDRHAAVQAFEREVLLTGPYRRLGHTHAATQTRLDGLVAILDNEESTEEQVNEAAEAMDELFNALSASAELIKACPKDLRKHKSIQKTSLKAIETARLAMRRATTISTLMEAVETYSSIVSSTAVSVRSSVCMRIIANARYFVCTAAVAATLPRRMAEMMDDETPTPADAQSATNPDGSDGSGDRIEFTFEHVILDEAGAMLEPDVIGTIVHGCRSLLSVGDHHQLPPFTKWQWASNYGYDVSLMMRLSQKAAKSHNMMTTQYRMHPHPAKIVSSQFYGDALQTGASTSRERTRRQPVLFLDVKAEEEKRGTSFFNKEEITAVVALVQKERLADATQTVNVICFHKPQFKEIRRELVKLGLMKENVAADSQSLPLLDVCTVDSMQGREADVVILSCVRTTQNSIGFLANVNRVNVALSRAKQVLYIVGNRAALTTDTTWRKVLNHQHVKRQNVA